MMTKIHRFVEPAQLARGAAEFVLGCASQALSENNRFSLVLAGGSTPSATYRALARVLPRSGLDQRKFEFYWGDERCVPPDHAQSNFGMAHQALLDVLEVAESQVYRMDCDGDPEVGAAAYERLLRDRFPNEGAPPFDLVLLGLGEDGHTASLFPGSASLEETRRWVAAERVKSLEAWRMTLTPPGINGSARVAFLVQGENKADAVHQVIAGAHDPLRWPAQVIEPRQGELHWFLDEAAAAKI
jgi:6-phosphogluconolactonase